MQSFKRQIYKISHFEEPKETPPEVDNNRKEYTPSIVNFETSDFTHNFRDADGDSYDSVRIRTLPAVGQLRFNGTIVEEGSIYSLDEIENLTYELPETYMTTPEGFCQFDRPINTIIQEKSAEGFELVHLGNGYIQFEKRIKNTIPNTSDIYVFFDITSMEVNDVEIAYNSIQDWYTDYKDTNKLFEGNLYILPINAENWLSFPSIIHRGSSVLVGNNTDYTQFTDLPENFDTTSNTINPNWETPSNVVIITFTDEVDSGDQITGTAYHRNRSDYGLSQQPSPQYETDYQEFTNIYGDFDFFRGVVYPIPNIEQRGFNNTGNAMVLQVLAAIDGKPTYTLQQLENLGVSFARERKFHWHLDPTNLNYTGINPTVANPYTEGLTLNQYGWVGVYDKNQPASTVFQSDTFESDLNYYLTNSSEEEVQVETIEGNCIESTEVCFNFQTSDDSQYNLFSNIASLCFDGIHDEDNITQYTAPTVSSTTEWIDEEGYEFKVSDFTTDFQDADGDSYKYARINTPFITTKGNVLEGLIENGSIIDFPIEIDLTEDIDISFDLTQEYNYYNERLYKFETDLVTQIKDLENQGYVILENKGDELVFNRLNDTVEHTTIKGKDIGDGNICLSFQTSDDSIYNLYSLEESFCLTLQGGNIPPTVADSEDIVLDNQFRFSNEHFTINFNKEPKVVKIESETPSVLGRLRYKGERWQTPFSFPIEEVENLTYQIPNRFVEIQGEIYSFERSIDEIITENTEQGYTLISQENGILVFEKQTGDNTENKYVVGNTVTTEEVQIGFRTSDSNDIPLFSNQATVTLTVPATETPIEFNQPPTVGNKIIEIEKDCRITQTDNNGI